METLGTLKYSHENIVMQKWLLQLVEKVIEWYGLCHYTFFFRLGRRKDNGSFSHNILHSQNILVHNPHLGFSIWEEMEGRKNALKKQR